MSDGPDFKKFEENIRGSKFRVRNDYGSTMIAKESREFCLMMKPSHWNHAAALMTLKDV